MNTKLIGLFLIIPILAIGGIYFGFLKIGDKNLFGQISLFRSSENNFQYVGEVVLPSETEPVAEEKKAAALRPLPKKISKKQAASKTQIQLFSTSAPIIQNIQSNIQTEPVQPTSTTQITETIQIQPAQTIQTATTTEPEAITGPVIAAPAPTSTPAPAIQAINRLLISEVLFGIEGNSDYEFIELYNAGSDFIDLTGWSIKKRSSTGSESALVVSSRFENKIIPAGKYLLIANEGGYSGTISADIFWPKSYTLAYSNNAVILYDSNGEKIEEISWQEIQKGQSIERVSRDSNEFRTQTNPNPQNSQSN